MSEIRDRQNSFKYQTEMTIGVRKHKISTRSEESLLLQDSISSGLLTANQADVQMAPSVSNGLVISQIYGGGGVANALFTHDFIELYNRGTTPVNVSNWSVQYAGAEDTSWIHVIGLPSVEIQPGQYFLIQMASGGSNGDPLSSPDLAVNIPMTTGSGKVALVNNSATLMGSCPTGSSIVDFVGYGSLANCSEGVPTSGPSAQNAAKRRSNGCVDNDLNRYDFSLAPPTPRNRLSPTNSCIGPTTGGRIAFTSNRSGTSVSDTDVFVMNADGSGQTRLTTDPLAEFTPSFSQDGSKIVFERNARIFSMNVDGSSQTELTPNSGNTEPRYSPDGSKIVFTSNRDANQEIYVMNANGTAQTRLTNNTATDRFPVFSPDGSKIAFVSNRDGQHEVYVMNSDGSNQIRLTNDPNKDAYAPVFSPDGSKIAYESETLANVTIVIMNVNGTNPTTLTPGIDFGPSFSPDGTAITFFTLRHGGNNFEIYTMNIDGSNQKNISVNPSADLEPSWGVVAGALTVTSVNSSAGSGSFGVGAVIPIQVTFGAPVTVTGTPRLRLATGGAGYPVDYSTGSGTAVLTFNYTVQAGHSSSDLDYLSTSSLELNGGSINSFGGTPAIISLPSPGAPGSLGANRNIIIDTTLPDTTINTGPTGTVASTSATFTFSSNEGGVTFECKLDAGSFGTCPSGIVYNNLPQGPHTFEVRAKDAALNVDPSPASRTWTVDTVAPETTIDSGPSGNVSSSSATFSFSSSEPGSTFQCSINNGAFAPCTSPTTFNSLAEGARSFAVRATDAVGNQDLTPATRNWNVDTVAPNTTIDSGPSGTVTTTIATFTFSSNESGVTFECSLDSAAYSPCTSGVVYGGLSQGQHTFNVRAIDSAQNIDQTPASRTWTADSIAPNTTIESGPIQGSSVANTSASFSFSSSEANSTFQCQLDGGGFSSCTSPVVLNGFSQGPHNFQVRATDAAGNTDQTPDVRTWTVDTVVPDTTIESGPSGFSSSTSATFTFSSNETNVTFLCSINGGLYSPCVSGVTFNGLAEGERSFGVRAIDAAGNQDGSPALRNWTIDTTAPDTTIFGGPTGTVTSTSATFQFSSNEGGASFQCRLDAAAFTSCTSPVTYNSLSHGQHTFFVRAVDQANNPDPTPAERSWSVDASATISGNVKQAPGLTNLSGVTMTLSGCANAVTQTNSLGNYSFGGLFSGACTVTPSGLGKLYDTSSRTFIVNGNVGNMDFLAYDSLAAVPRKLRIVNQYTAPGQSAVISVRLNSQGNESSVAFSVDFEESMFVGNPVVTCGVDAGVGCGLTVVNGSVGITVIPQGGGTFAAGDREVVKITFQTQPTSSPNALMDLTGSPTAVLLRNPANDPLQVELVDGFIVYQQGLEGDLAERPSGNGGIFLNDVIVARQIAVNPSIVNPAYNEFQRADIAPAASKGDGLITTADVVQARRYASGVDTPAAAGGPFQPGTQGALAGLVADQAQRVVRVAERTGVAGQKVIIPVEMKTDGSERAVRFTLQYDAMKLSNPEVSLVGVAPSDAVLTIYDKDSGRLTVLVDAGTAFGSTDGALVNVTFDIASEAASGESVISFGDDGSIADAMANELHADYLSASLTINGGGTPEVAISGRVITPSGIGVRNARVSLVGPNGYLRTVTTSTLGYYGFDGVPMGNAYVLQPVSKQWRFEPRSINAASDLSNVDFVGID